MVGDRIKELRDSHHMTQKELAKQLHITNKRISDWEKQGTVPSVDMVIRISKFFSVTTDYILGVDSKKVLVVEKLSNEEIAAIQALINSLEKSKHVDS